jgi:hypothetical protein
MKPNSKGSSYNSMKPIKHVRQTRHVPRLLQLVFFLPFVLEAKKPSNAATFVWLLFLLSTSGD